MRIFALSGLCLAALTAIAHAAPPCPPDALGTARRMTVGADSAVAIGLKTYPRTLALADREVVLTFDDGPWGGTTAKVLDALAAECVKATFFLIGRNAAAHPDLARRIWRDGHSIGHHSYSHPALTLRGLSDAAARADIDRGFASVDLAAHGAAGAAPKTGFFRFPGFGDTPALVDWLLKRNVSVFGTDIWASDWLDMTPEAELALVMRRLEQKGRGIILFHDTKVSTAAMLPAFLRALKAKNYRIVHLVAGPGATATTPAPAGWSSETERTLTHVWPKAPPQFK